jgi:hypothetical protein
MYERLTIQFKSRGRDNNDFLRGAIIIVFTTCVEKNITLIIWKKKYCKIMFQHRYTFTSNTVYSTIPDLANPSHCKYNTLDIRVNRKMGLTCSNTTWHTSNVSLYNVLNQGWPTQMILRATLEIHYDPAGHIQNYISIFPR